MGFSDSLFSGDSGRFLERKDLLSNVAASRQIIRDGKTLLNRSFIDEVIKQCLENKRYRSALSMLNPMIKLLPGDSALWFKRGQCLFGMRKLRPAWRSFHHALKFDPVNLEVLLEIGSLFIAVNKLRRAESFFSRAIEFSPLNGDTLFSIGKRYMNAGHFRKALPYLENSMNLNPDDADTVFQLAVCYEYLKEYTAAMSYYDKYLFIEPHCEIGWFNRGVLLEKTKRPQEAIQSYQFAINLREDFSEAHFNLGNLYADNDEYDKAFGQFEKVVQLCPKDAAAFYNLGALHEDNQNYSKAIYYYSVCIELNETFQEAFLGRGYCYLKNNSVELAMEDFRHAVLMSIPGYFKIQANSQKRTDRIAQIDKALANLIQQPEKHNSSHAIQIVRKYLITGKVPDALRYVRTLNNEKFSPDLIAILLAYVYFAMGNSILGYGSLFSIHVENHKAAQWMKKLLPAVYHSRFFRELLLLNKRNFN
jgi:tetratricopeptide (TPR) repeat protein